MYNTIVNSSQADICYYLLCNLLFFLAHCVHKVAIKKTAVTFCKQQMKNLFWIIKHRKMSFRIKVTDKRI